MIKETEGNKIISAGSAIPAILIATAITVSLLGYAPVSRKLASTMVNAQPTRTEQNAAASARFNWDVRLANSVADVTGSELVLNGRDGSTIRYAFDNRAHTLTRTAGRQVSTILAGVESVTFSLYETPALYNEMRVTTAAKARVVGLKWRSVGAPEQANTPQAAMATLAPVSR